MSLSTAIRLAKMGFHIFPIVPNSKLPAIFSFPTQATRDVDRIKKWWLDPVLEIEQPYNIGISTSNFGDDEQLLVVDIDNKGDKNGDDAILNLELEGFLFETTFSQRTPNSGEHLVYKTSQRIGSSVGFLGSGIDTRGFGGYIVAVSSELDGKKYKSNFEPIKSAPKWLIEKCDRIPEVAETKAPIVDLNEERAIERAVDYLKNHAPLSVEGDGGDQTTYKVAARIKDFGVTKGNAYDILIEHWNGRCSPPWDAFGLKEKVIHAYKYGKNTPGASSPEADFAPASTSTASSSNDDETDEGSYLRGINKDYAIIFGGNDHTILYETLDEKGRAHRVFMSERSFRRKFSPYTVQQGKGRALSYAENWLDWAHRRQYNGVCFAPERKARHNYYNLWRGFTVAPLAYKQATADARLGFNLFLEHAKENICQGDHPLFIWLIGYFAHLVQMPYERPLTTLVFKGTKGVGKNALIDRIGFLLGSTHYLVAHDGRYLTSNFNGHLDSCLCLVLDEAFWSGDKAAEGKLKGLTTATEIPIERKGKEIYMVDNLARLVVIGNEDWIVPASSDERRYAIFEVGEKRKQDMEFFKSMRILMEEKQGARVLLDYLQNFDLTQVNVNKAPHTAALLDQKLSSLGPLAQWWLECLGSGVVSGGDFSEGWPPEIYKSQVRDAFGVYCKERQIKSRIPYEGLFTKELKRMCRSLVPTKKREGTGARPQTFQLPTLEVARQEWDKFIGHDMAWD